MNYKLKISVLFFFILYSFKCTAQDQNEVNELTVESNHSTVQFSIPIANGLTKVTGKFKDYSIDLKYVDEDLTKSSISAVIQAKSIDTGISDRDEHLRTKDFFEVETYPEISFESHSIQKNEAGYLVKGQFNMHGESKIIEFPLQMNGQLGKNTIGFSCQFVINRNDFKIASDFKHSSIENFLSDEILVEVDFWTKRKKKN